LLHQLVTTLFYILLNRKEVTEERMQEVANNSWTVWLLI
jgi:hypothetical protein